MNKKPLMIGLVLVCVLAFFGLAMAGKVDGQGAMNSILTLAAGFGIGKAASK